MTEPLLSSLSATLTTPMEQSASAQTPHVIVAHLDDDPRPYTVLVVDDQATNRDLLCRHLRLLGHAHLQACDGIEAIDVMSHAPVDLVLLDLMMPRMNGYEALEHMRASPHLAQIPVIVITAVQDYTSAARCIELGAVDYLFKPFNSTLLRARINNCRERLHYARAAQAHLDELTALQQFDSELAASMTVEQVAKIAVSWALRHTSAQAALLASVHDDHLIVLAAQGYAAGSIAVGDHLPWGMDKGEKTEDRGPETEDGGLPTSASSLATSDHGLPASVYRPPSSIFAQTHTTFLYHDGQLFAVLLTEYDGTSYGAHELVYLDRLANRAVLALVKAQLYAAVQQANNAKSEFMAVLAHELKTPLTVIKGYVQLLREGALLGVAPDRLYDVIAANADTMRTLISELDDISRIEAGQIMLDDHLVALDATLHSVIQSLQPQITAKEQTCQVHSAITLPPIRGDANRIMQILTNLLSNALKYTPNRGTITIHLSSVGNVVRCSIRDTGIGIHRDDQPRIFGRFSRAKDAAARTQTGTGLGLYITKRLVELHGGRIWFESEFRAGTVFTVEFPTP